ncbi:MAG: hypothetical protein O7G87_21170 [bacterium]|nr:hypothetical protein [bacterium]
MEPIRAFALNYNRTKVALIKRAIERAEGNISAAARLLEIDRAKVYRILKLEK